MTSPEAETDQATRLTGSSKPAWIVPPRTPALTWWLTLLAGLAVGGMFGALAQEGYVVMLFFRRRNPVIPSDLLPVGLVAGCIAGALAAIFWCRATLHRTRMGCSPVPSGAVTGLKIGGLAGIVPHLPLSYVFEPNPIVLIIGVVCGLVAGAVAGGVCGLVLRAQLADPRKGRVRTKEIERA